VILTGRRDVMRVHVNGRLTQFAAYGVAGLITAMNVVLLVLQFGA
jgi:Mn2+/Fe2+ NRAMP family transporter